jgi:hypothetical protein
VNQRKAHLSRQSSSSSTTPCSEFIDGMGMGQRCRSVGVWETAEEGVSIPQKIVPALKAWLMFHKSACKTSKTNVTIFSPPRKALPSRPTPLVLNSVELPFSPSLAMLGCVLDTRLSFMPRPYACVRRASTAFTGVMLLGRNRAGMNPTYLGRLFVSTVAIRLFWCASNWLKPGEGVSKDLSVWRWAVLLVTGAVKMSLATY